MSSLVAMARVVEDQELIFAVLFQAKLLSASIRRGASASFLERRGLEIGHLMPIAGSFQRTLRSWAGLYSEVTL